MGNTITHAVSGRSQASSTSAATEAATSTASRVRQAPGRLLQPHYQQQQQQQHHQQHQQQQHHQQHQQQRHQQHQHKSKTLPARHPRSATVNSHPNSNNNNNNTASPPPPPPPNGETSRVLFLLYLIHRTWNVVVDTVDTRSKRSQRRSAPSKDSAATPADTYFADAATSSCGDGNYSLTITDLDDVEGGSSLCCSQYSFCSCSYCYDATQNVYNSIGEDCSIDSICQRTVSRCGSDFSTYYRGYQMAPSVCQNSPKLPPHNGAAAAVVAANAVNAAAAIGTASTSSVTQKSNCGSSSLNGSMASYKMSSSENSWPQAVFSKENQRPPVYNPEDYAQSLKKFGKRQSGQNARSIYDTSDTQGEEVCRAATLPHKHSEYKSPIPAPLESDSEMSLRQFASVTDLLTKLRADLRVSFPSFVQEFIATPSDGVSLLLEVLRAIQLSQATNSPPPVPAAQMTASMPRNAQSYQRRALLDELACLQCLSICCSRSLDATARLGTTSVGLMPLASSATGQGIRARILAMQLMAAACDRHALGHGSQKVVAAGHTAVSEAMSTLRLRCSEPVRFRLLVGMLNSGGGSGELQAIGVKFINTFLESSQNLQQRLYLQAELFQAGFESHTLTKTISASSPWLDALRNEIKHFNEIYVDVDKMLTQARDADRVRSQMVILERRVQILHEEKAVLTSMERRLQERCAELQREIFRLQGAQNENTFKSLDKHQPVALPRHVPPGHSKQDSSEHEDEGISSSETGPSLSPVPILVLPQKPSVTAAAKAHKQLQHKQQTKDLDDAATIEDVMEELDNIVSEAEKQISTQHGQCYNAAHMLLPETKEQEIVPVNIVPQPPRKSRSLAHLVSQPGGSELDGSEYGMLLNHAAAAAADQAAVERVNALQTFFDEADYDMPETDKPYAIESPDIPEVNCTTAGYNPSTTRELLDVIMNARHTEDDPTMKAFREGHQTMQPNVTNAQHRRSSYVEPAAPGALVQVAHAKKPQAPAQQFNGVFFMTGMNKPQKYPKPDLSAALQARRVTKNVERLEAAFAGHEPSTDAGGGGGALVASREKSRSNQQIYFGSNPTLRINTSYGSYTNNVTVINNVTTRTRSYTQGSKVTDIPSGLY